MRSRWRRDRVVPAPDREQDFAVGMRAPGQESRRIAKRWEVGVSAITSFNLGSGASPSLFLRDQDEAPIFGSGPRSFSAPA